MNKNLINWLIFAALSLIWGSSFILMKFGLQRLSAFQVAAIRISSAGLVLLPIAIKNFNKIPRNKLFLVFLSSVLGNLVPAFLFCIAEEKIESGLAGVLNSLTPIFVIITGALFFQAKTSFNKIVGIAIAFSGCAMLFVVNGGSQQKQHLFYALYIVLATLLYGLNVNLVHKYLKHIQSLHIAAVALALNGVVALIILVLTGYFNLPLTDNAVLFSTVSAAVLGISGTAIATIIFYMLLKRAGAVFSTMVTYSVPVVAIFWGVVAGEEIGWLQVLCMLVILCGVYLANKKRITDN